MCAASSATPRPARSRRRTDAAGTRTSREAASTTATARWRRSMALSSRKHEALAWGARTARAIQRATCSTSATGGAASPSSNTARSSSRPPPARSRSMGRSGIGTTATVARRIPALPDQRRAGHQRRDRQVLAVRAGSDLLDTEDRRVRGARCRARQAVRGGDVTGNLGYPTSELVPSRLTAPSELRARPAHLQPGHGQGNPRLTGAADR